KDIVKSSNRVINYNLLENRWLKKIVTSFISTLRQFSETVENTIYSLEKENLYLKTKLQIIEQAKYAGKKKSIAILRQYREQSRLMKRGFEQFLQSFWINDVTDNNNHQFTPFLNMDSRYRVLYQLYRKLRSKQFHIDIDSGFSSQWKSTDRLYEIWGYIHICKTLLRLNYRLNGGWFFDQTTNIFISTLKSGT